MSVKKIFKCLRCAEPCVTTVFSEDMPDNIDIEAEIWLICNTCSEAVMLSSDMFKQVASHQVH